jgi:hypothetical protein
MFRWYREAAVCYAYLTDVTDASQIGSSRWFTRGWTLQELVAPATVWFYTLDWEYLGSKMDLQSVVQLITGIDAEVLTTGELETVNIAKRMSWAAKRQTTRIEDRAYSLMGIFDVNMPLLYGEGKKSFARLQEAIMKTSDDHSLFAWGLPAEVKTMQQFLASYETPVLSEWRGLFANSPSEFTHCDQIHVLEDVQSTVPPIVSNNGVRIELQFKQYKHTNVQFAVIYCTLHGRYKHYLGVPIQSWGERWVARCGELITIPVADLVSSESDKPFCQPTILLVKAPRATYVGPPVDNKISMVYVANEHKERYVLTDVHCTPNTSYSPLDTSFTLSEDKDTLHAVLYFACAKSDPFELFEKLRDDPTHTFKGHGNQADGGISFYLKTGLNTYSAAYPPFALLIGGPISDPWVEALTVLGDEHANADFMALHTVDARLTRACTTKRHLSSLLCQDTMVSPLHGHQSGQDAQLIMCQNTASWDYGAHLKRCFKVDASITMLQKDLVQHGLVLFVEVTKFTETGNKTRTKVPDSRPNQPRWWASERINE